MILYKILNCGNILYFYKGLFYVYKCLPMCPKKLEDGVGSSGTWGPDGHEFPCQCWEPHLDPLLEQIPLLNVEPSFQPWKYCLKSSSFSDFYYVSIIGSNYGQEDGYTVAKLIFQDCCFLWSVSLHCSIPFTAMNSKCIIVLSQEWW